MTERHSYSYDATTGDYRIIRRDGTHEATAICRLSFWVASPMLLVGVEEAACARLCDYLDGVPADSPPETPS